MTSTDISNLALSILKSSSINDIDDTKDHKSYLCKAWYEIRRKNLLQEGNWRFALKEINLIKAKGNSFLLPPDLLKIIKFSDKNTIQIGNIAKSDNDFLKLTYIKDEKNTSNFTSTFIEALVYSLAYQLSFEIIGDKNTTQFIETKYLELLKKSKENLEFPFKKIKSKSSFLYNRYVT